jgi:hypothetical protein
MGSAGGTCGVGIGVNAMTARSGTTGVATTSAATPGIAIWLGLPGLGLRYISAIEYSIGGTAAFNGTNGAYVSTGLHCDAFA